MENQKQRLKEHEYCSRKLTSEEINKVELADFQCESCGASVFDLDDFPETENIDDWNCLCEDCYDNEYRALCDICEDSYEPREGSKEYLVFSKTNEVEIDKIGIYEILKYPYFIF